MEDDEMDDFGDLYADLDDQVNAGYSTRDGAGRVPVPVPVPVGANASAAGDEEEVEEVPVVAVAGDASSSDSEDDLRIVLNEHDSSDPIGSQRVGLVSAAGEDEDLVIVSGEGGKDRSWPDKLLPSINSAAPTDNERSLRKHHRRYAGSNSFGYTRNMNMQTMGRMDWEKLHTEWIGGAAFCNYGVASYELNKFGFSLPRSRTIFDLNIESLESKPWRHQGVDITDFFNFGLDEDGWKSYCTCMDFYRQQTFNTAPSWDYELPKPNQVVDRDISGDVGGAHKEGASSFPEGADKRGRCFEMKGRAIQVEGGEHDRIPSFDIRRPRYRDSDVVIQVTLEEPEEVSVPGKAKEPKHANDLVENSQAEHDGELGLVSAISSIETNAQHVTRKGDEVHSSAVDGESNSGADIVDFSSSFHSESNSDDESFDGACPEIVFTPGLNISVSTDVQVKEPLKHDKCPMNDSRCKNSSSDEAAHHTSHDYDYSVRSFRNRRMGKDVNVSKDTFKDSHWDSRVWRSDVNCKETSHGRRYRRYNHDFSDMGCFSCRQSDRSAHYIRRRDEAKKFYNTPCTKFSHRNSCLDRYSTKELDRKKLSFERRNLAGDDILHENFLRANDHDESVPYNRFNQSISNHQYLLKEKYYPLCLRRQKARRNIRTIYDERASEGVQQMHGRHSTNRNKIEETVDNRHNRLLVHTSRVINLEDSCREDQYFDIDKSVNHDSNNSMHLEHLDHNLLISNGMAEHIAYDRGLENGSLLEHDISVSSRTNKWHPVSRGNKNREVATLRNSKLSYYIPQNADPRYSFPEKISGLEESDCILEGRAVHDSNVSLNKKRRHTVLAKRCPHNSFEGSAKFKKCGDLISDMFSPSIPIHNNSNLEQDVDNGWKSCDELLDEKAAKKCTEFRMSEYNSSVTNIFNHDVHTLASVGCRKAVNIHINGGEGKVPRRYSKIDRGSVTFNDAVDKMDNMKDHMRNALFHPVDLKGKGFIEAKSGYSDGCILKSCSYDKHPTTHNNEDDELEEGELIERPVNEEIIFEEKALDVEKGVGCQAIESSGSNSADENNIRLEDCARSSKHNIVCDNNRILEALEKMEKRKARFKEPISLKEGSKKSHGIIEDTVVVGELKQLRPARKRRWGVS